MPINQLRLGAAAAALALLAATSQPSFAQKKYDPGASDTEIKIGNIMPYSGPASAYGVIGKTEEAYFKKINAEGGINGRKINFISYDDAYSPPKTVEQARKLVESDEVLLVFNPLGTPPNTAIQKYLNDAKVPQLFVATGASKWGHYKENPWTMGFQPDYVTEAIIYAKHIMANVKDPKIAVLMIGTNNSNGYLKRYPSDIDLGALVCFDEATGKFLWQHSSEKLPTGRVHDWPLQGICCSPLVEGNRLWFVTSRGEVRCLDVAGFYDGKDDGRPEKQEPARLFDIRRADDPAEDKVTGYLAELDAGKIPADVRDRFAAAGMPLPAGDIALKVDEAAKAPS